MLFILFFLSKESVYIFSAKHCSAPFFLGLLLIRKFFLCILWGAELGLFLKERFIFEIYGGTEREPFLKERFFSEIYGGTELGLFLKERYVLKFM